MHRFDVAFWWWFGLEKSSQHSLRSGLGNNCILPFSHISYLTVSSKPAGHKEVSPREFDVHSRWKPEREAEEKKKKKKPQKKTKKKKKKKKEKKNKKTNEQKRMLVADLCDCPHVL